MERTQTIEELRNILLQQVDEINNNTGEYKKAKTISMLSYNVLSSYKTQLAAAQLLGIALDDATINQMLNTSRVKSLK